MTRTVVEKIQTEKCGREMIQAVSRRHLKAEARVRFQDTAFQIYSEHSGIGTGFSPSASVFPCQYHSTITPYSFIHLPPTLYNVFLPVLQFSPVRIIPPLLHTHPSIYHPHCIMFFSQYFSFPCQYHSTIAPHSCSYTHCSSPEGQAGEAWEPSIKQFSFFNRRELRKKKLTV